MHVIDIFSSILKGRLPPVKAIPESLQNMAATMASLRGKVSELSSIERVMAAFRHKEPDHVPVTPLLCSGARQIRGIPWPDFALNAEKAAQVYMDGFEFVGGDLIILLLDLSVEAADFGQHVVYPEQSTPRPDYNNPVIKDADGYEKLKGLDFSTAARMQEFVRLCQIIVDKVGLRALPAGFVFGPLGVLSMMRGAEEMFKDCLLHPKKVIRACEIITPVLLEFVQAQCDTGVPAIAIDTLFASKNGLSKPLWEEIEGPFAREISRVIKKNGRIVGIHNCGHDIYFDAQIRSMDPDVISFAHLPDDCKTPRDLKERYGDRITLLGYVPRPLLVNGTPMEVMDACRKQIDDLAKNGGYVLAPGCEYPPNIPLTNAFALIKAANVYG